MGFAVGEDVPGRVVSTSVFGHEERFARAHLPGTCLLEDSLSSQVARAHADARVLTVMIHDHVEVEALEVFRALEGIVTRSDGFDHLPLRWMRENGVRGYHLGGYATESVAHHALMFMLMLLRRVPEAGGVVGGMSPVWDRSSLMGRHLEDVTVGVLGVGRIGSKVASLVSGLGGRVVGFDIDPDPRLEVLEGFRFVSSLDALLERSDVLSLHVPLDSSTRGLIGDEALAMLPEGACLVNTARGGIVDHDAVVEALWADRLGGYATDVLPGEPTPPDLERLAGLERVVVTPHLAAYDERTVDARYARTARIVDALVTGEGGSVENLRVV